jgi:hypothetical protein
VQPTSLLPELPENSGIEEMLFKRLEANSGEEYRDVIRDHFEKGRDNLFENVVRKATQDQAPSEIGLGKLLTTSGTYGENDVLTLTWLTELLASAKGSFQSLQEAITDVITKVQKATLQNYKDESVGHRPELVCLLYRERHSERSEKQKGKRTERKLSKSLEHPFPLVRLVQLLQARHKLKSDQPETRPDPDLTEDELGGRVIREYFESGLHEHIAFYSIPDSRFDPAFLVFCLEGALRFPTSMVSTEAIDRALSILEESQEKTPFWRSLTPILASPQGDVLFPVSVEVANSLLRITELLDRRYEEPKYFLRCRPLLDRYVRWLKAQRVENCRSSCAAR